MDLSKPLYHRRRFPAEIISHCVWLYFRFCLSYRDVEEMMAERGIVVTYETIRDWSQKFGATYAKRLRSQTPRPGDRWHLDEVYLSINGKLQYLWRAVDQDGEVLDILVQPLRNRQAAKKFFRKLLQRLQGGGIARCRAHTRQAIEQSRGEFPPANARTRTSHAGLQVSRTRPAVSRHLWGNRNVLSSRPPFAGHPELPGSHAPTLHTMGRRDQSGF